MTKLDGIMHQKNISNIKLARTLGVSEGAVSAWKRGAACVPQKRREALAQALGVSVEEILDSRGLAKLAEEGDER